MMDLREYFEKRQEETKKSIKEMDEKLGFEEKVEEVKYIDMDSQKFKKNNIDSHQDSTNTTADAM